jgi:hypothetical protein
MRAKGLHSKDKAPVDDRRRQREQRPDEQAADDRYTQRTAHLPFSPKPIASAARRARAIVVIMIGRSAVHA